MALDVLAAAGFLASCLGFFRIGQRSKHEVLHVLGTVFTCSFMGCTHTK